MKKRLLILTNEPPFPVKTGYSEYLSSQIKILSRIFDIYVLALADSQDQSYRRKFSSSRHIQKTWIFPHQIRIGSSPILLFKYLFSLISPWPYTLIRDFHPGYRRLLHSLHEKYRFDCLLVNPLSLTANLSSQLLSDHSCLKIIDVDLLRSRYYLDLAKATRNPITKSIYWLESRKQFIWERWLLARFDRIVYLDYSYYSYLSGRLGLPKEKLFKSFFYLPVSRRSRAQPGGVKLLFLGNMLWKPNRDGLLIFLNQIWPRVLKKMPRARLSIVGMIDYETRRIIANIPSVKVKGYVKDLGPVFARSRLLVSPIKTSGGVRVKILKALSAGLPVVCTPESLRGHPDLEPHCLTYKNPAHGLAQIFKLVNNEATVQKYSLSGRQYIRKKYNRLASLIQAKRIFNR